MLIAEETSEPFTVYSAKKFPGMTGTAHIQSPLHFLIYSSHQQHQSNAWYQVVSCNKDSNMLAAVLFSLLFVSCNCDCVESTELSKAFARQGLKIPIRNDLRVRKVNEGTPPLFSTTVQHV